MALYVEISACQRTITFAKSTLTVSHESSTKDSAAHVGASPLPAFWETACACNPMVHTII